MKKTVLFSAILLALLLDQCLGHSSGAVFYVKPTAPAGTECPSDDSPCHSLQYYANHSTFTNNSMFLFLEGEHHLDSVVRIRNVANLSLIGVSARVQILCTCQILTAFNVEQFVGLTIESVTIINCTGYAFCLDSGREASLERVTIISSSQSGLSFIDVFGAFSIFKSTLQKIYVEYSICNSESSNHFNFSTNYIAFSYITIKIECSNVHILITDSMFHQAWLDIDYDVLTNNSVQVRNSIFLEESTVWVTVCDPCTTKSDPFLNCGPNFLQFTDNIFNHAYYASCIKIDFRFSNTKECTALLTDSVASCVLITRDNDILTDNFIQAVFHNFTFANGNRGKDGDSEVLSLQSVTVLLENSTFENNIASGINAANSTVIFQGNNTFRNNSALFGAGMMLTQHSYIVLKADTHILFADNHADYVGGAIYTDSKPCDSCFFRVNSPVTDTRVSFVRNAANYAGSSLYGNIWSCCEGHDSCHHLYDVFNTSNTEENPSAISSDPYRICSCHNEKLQPNCSPSKSGIIVNVYAFPGQDFPVRLAVVSEYFNGVVISAIHAFFNADIASIKPHQVTQTSNSDKPHCDNFYYSVSTNYSTATLHMRPENTYLLTKEFSATFYVDVTMKPCPLGFTLSPATKSCVCDPRFGDNIVCDINDQSFLIRRPANTWIGFVNDFSSNSTGVLYHPNCPIGYCLPHTVKVTSNTSDSQCESHRTGLLCGRCEDGYSLTLSSGKCAKCSNTHLFLIAPLAVAGLLLVVLLFALNLTVTEGSINGLVFYANVIGMTYNALFPGEGNYLYMLIAWINLDLGIATCLFTGLDSYVITWLQFTVPVYLWVILPVIMSLCNKFPALAKRLGGENTVKVLATVLLLTYTKLLRTVATILTFTTLTYPDGGVRYVWLYDANVDFFKGKHLYLGIFGILVLVFLLVPYTFCITFFQQLQACSGHRLFRWVNKLKPIFDAYAGPYKDKYRFWTGMLLLVRALVIILFAVNTAESADFNLLIILIVSCLLLMAHSDDKYKKWPYNYIEYFFYLQLAVFSGAMFYARHNSGSITAVADTSIGLSLVAFLAVVGYHIKMRMKPLKSYWYQLKGFVDIDQEEQEFVHERVY